MSGHGLPRSIPDVYARLDALEGGGASVEWDNIEDKPDFATVATSGAYSDLTGAPSLAFNTLSGTVADATGSDLQAILEDLASRIAALESA